MIYKFLLEEALTIMKNMGYGNADDLLWHFNDADMLPTWEHEQEKMLSLLNQYPDLGRVQYPYRARSPKEYCGLRVAESLKSDDPFVFKLWNHRYGSGIGFNKRAEWRNETYHALLGYYLRIPMQLMDLPKNISPIMPLWIKANRDWCENGCL